MAGYIEDRWLTKRPDPTTGKRRRTALYGKGKRYKVAGIPGVRARSFPDGKLAEAKRWLATTVADAERDEFIDPRSAKITLAEYIDKHWWPGRGYDRGAREAVASRLGHIKALLGAQPLSAIKAPQLRVFLTELEKRLGPGTSLEVWGYLSAVLQAAVDDERLRKNPCKVRSIQLPVRPESLVQPWIEERVVAVRAALRPRFRAMVDVGAGAGMRQGEVFGLADEDIDPDAEVIHVRRQVKKVGAKLVFAPPKGGKTRVVPAPPYLLKVLAAHMAEVPPMAVTLPWRDPDEPTTEREAKARMPQTHRLIFTGVQGGALRRDSWNLREWKPALAEVGVIPPPEVVRRGTRNRQELVYEESREHGFHVLRHTFASVQLHARESVVAVSKWLGHADPSITLRVYAHMMPEADGRGRQAMQAWFEALPAETP